jgi:hypothetical protein
MVGWRGQSLMRTTSEVTTPLEVAALALALAAVAGDSVASATLVGCALRTWTLSHFTAAAQRQRRRASGSCAIQAVAVPRLARHLPHSAAPRPGRTRCLRCVVAGVCQLRAACIRTALVPSRAPKFTRHAMPCHRKFKIQNSQARTAHELRAHVRRCTGGLTLSCGIAPNKLLARLVSAQLLSA